VLKASEEDITESNKTGDC